MVGEDSWRLATFFLVFVRGEMAWDKYRLYYASLLWDIVVLPCVWIWISYLNTNFYSLLFGIVDIA